MSTLTKLIESATEVATDDSVNLLIESSFAEQLTGRKWKVRVIKGDVQGSSAFYSKELLESHADVVKKGTRIYIDHKQPGERPERKAENLAGYFESDSYYENGDLFAEAAIFSDKIDWVKERAEAGMIGLSITGSGVVVEESGRKVARTLDTIDSVDIVTRAGAGGEFVEMTESKSEEVEKEEIMELPKDLLEALDAQAAAMNAVATKIDTLIEAQKPVEEEVIEESGPTTEAVAEALLEAGLTATGRKSVYAAVEAGTELEEAIKAEAEREKSILEESKVTAFGAGDSAGDKEPVSASKLIFG